MKSLSIRSLTWLLVLAGGLVALATGTYGALRIIPVVREVRTATAPLVELSRRLRGYDTWIQQGAALAERTVNAPGPARLDSLDRWMGRYDQLAGALRIADVPDSVRVLLAAADGAAARFSATGQEIGALIELGRRADAAARLEISRQLAREVRALAAESQARSLERLIVAQGAVEALSTRLLGAFVVWMMGTAAVLLVAFRFVRRRVQAPLAELQTALGRVAGGDLDVELPPRADDEIGGLARQFSQMTAVLRSRAETQGQMAAAGVLLGNVAHEINNPLMAIGATAESRLADPSVPAPVRRDLEAVLEQVRRASRLVSGIVRFVRAAPASESRADVNEAAREAVELMAVQFAADGVECAFELGAGLPPAAATGQALERILVALLANAHEALGRGAETGTFGVKVRTWADAGRVFVEVSDTGPGVAQEVRPRLFLPFSTTRSGGHVGLGLYTARRIAREAGGDVTFAPHAEGTGATFVVALPAAPAPVSEPAAAPARAPHAAGLEGRRVLLVDDEEMVRAPLARFLARRGAIVREAGDGLEALSVIAAEQPDVIVADLRMPGMDGTTLLRAVRDRDPALAARMLFLSGDVGQLGADAGDVAPDRILPKPIELAEFERFLLRNLDG